MKGSLVTQKSLYQEQYESKCSKWRSQPVFNRTCNDFAFVVAFCIILGFFIGAGSYYINENGNNTETQILYVINRAKQFSSFVGISLAFSLIYIILIVLAPVCMVIAIYILEMCIMVWLAYYTYAILGIIAISIVFLVIALIYLIGLLCCCSRIKIGLILIRLGCTFIREKCGVLISPIMLTILNLLLLSFWIYSLSCLYAISNNKQSNGQDNTAQKVFIGLWFFIWFFFYLVFYYASLFTTAVACSFWYYKVEGNYIFTAFKWLLKSFGSLVFGALLVVVVSLARLVVDQSRRQKKNLVATFCLAILLFFGNFMFFSNYL